MRLREGNHRPHRHLKNRLCPYLRQTKSFPIGVRVQGTKRGHTGLDLAGRGNVDGHSDNTVVSGATAVLLPLGRGQGLRGIAHIAWRLCTATTTTTLRDPFPSVGRKKNAH